MHGLAALAEGVDDVMAQTAAYARLRWVGIRSAISTLIAMVLSRPGGTDHRSCGKRSGVSTGVIFLAELGDKSQLMALAFASRYRPWPVLAGITISTALVHALSVIVGAGVAGQLPTETINVVAGVAFLAFAAWTLRGGTS